MRSVLFPLLNCLFLHALPFPLQRHLGCSTHKRVYHRTKHAQVKCNGKQVGCRPNLQESPQWNRAQNADKTLIAQIHMKARQDWNVSGIAAVSRNPASATGPAKHAKRLDTSLWSFCDSVQDCPPVLQTGNRADQVFRCLSSSGYLATARNSADPPPPKKTSRIQIAEQKAHQIGSGDPTFLLLPLMSCGLSEPNSLQKEETGALGIHTVSTFVNEKKHVHRGKYSHNTKQSGEKFQLEIGKADLQMKIYLSFLCEQNNWTKDGRQPTNKFHLCVCFFLRIKAMGVWILSRQTGTDMPFLSISAWHEHNSVLHPECTISFQHPLTFVWGYLQQLSSDLWDCSALVIYHGLHHQMPPKRQSQKNIFPLRLADWTAK